MDEKRLTFATELALQAGALLREGYGRSIEINLKGEIDLVTEYDLRSEELLVKAIRKAYPDDAILAEEKGAIGEGEFRWLIDPLDGTTNFAHGIPIFTVSIAYVKKNKVLLGVVYDPMQGELFHAIESGGAWLDGRRLQVSQTRILNDSLLVTGFPYNIRTSPNNNLAHSASLTLRTRGTRRLGAASLDLAYVAAGRFEGYWEVQSFPWDLGAGMLMVQEAGGRVTHINGNALRLDEETAIVATNGHIHDELLTVLNPESDDASI
jgi:myo-inositol-1(or 4)-monophosphatase